MIIKLILISELISAILIQIQCNPDIRELSEPENKSLISGLFCLGNTGCNFGQDKIFLISGFLISGLHCTSK